MVRTERLPFSRFRRVHGRYPTYNYLGFVKGRRELMPELPKQCMPGKFQAASEESRSKSPLLGQLWACFSRISDKFLSKAASCALYNIAICKCTQPASGVGALSARRSSSAILWLQYSMSSFNIRVAPLSDSEDSVTRRLQKVDFEQEHGFHYAAPTLGNARPRRTDAAAVRRAGEPIDLGTAITHRRFDSSRCLPPLEARLKAARPLRGPTKETRCQ